MAVVQQPEEDQPIVNEPLLHQPTFTKVKFNAAPPLKAKKTFTKEVTQEFKVIKPVAAPLAAVAEVLEDPIVSDAYTSIEATIP